MRKMLWILAGLTWGCGSAAGGTGGQAVSDAVADTADVVVPQDQSDAATDAQNAETAPDTGLPGDVTGGDAADVTVACSCGDAVCNAACGETLATCPVDCAVCGDKVCSPGESPATCTVDCCGSCGDGKCVGYACGENPTTCAQDCLSPCGNGTCDKGENPGNCPADCAKQV